MNQSDKHIEVIVDAQLSCGEGPLWEARKERLLYVDSDLTFLYASDEPGKQKMTLSDDIQVSSVALAKSGYVLLGDGLWLMDFNGKKEKLLDSFQEEKLFFNDSIVGPDGRIYAGTYYWDEQGMVKTGKLFRLEPGCDPVVLDEGIELSNGFAFSPNDDMLYYSDSAKKCVYCYDFDKVNGTIANKRVFIRSEIGIPDGITSDSDGNIWCAMWYEGAVHCYAPDGSLVQIYHFPAKQTSSVGFGGSLLDTLYVTSAGSLFESHMMPADFDRTAYLGGKIFSIKPGVKGRPEYIAKF